MAIQMGITIGAGVFLGQYLDRKFNNEKGIFTAVCALVFVTIAIYIPVRSVLKDNK